MRFGNVALPISTLASISRPVARLANANARAAGVCEELPLGIGKSFRAARPCGISWEHVARGFVEERSRSLVAKSPRRWSLRCTDDALVRHGQTDHISLASGSDMISRTTSLELSFHQDPHIPNSPPAVRWGRRLRTGSQPLEARPERLSAPWAGPRGSHASFVAETSEHGWGLVLVGDAGRKGMLSWRLESTQVVQGPVGLMGIVISPSLHLWTLVTNSRQEAGSMTCLPQTKGSQHERKADCENWTRLPLACSVGYRVPLDTDATCIFILLLACASVSAPQGSINQSSVKHDKYAGLGPSSCWSSPPCTCRCASLP